MGLYSPAEKIWAEPRLTQRIHANDTRCRYAFSGVEPIAILSYDRALELCLTRCIRLHSPLSLAPPFAKPSLSVKAPVYVALLHYPMRNRLGDQVATAVTNLDIHDISRSCRTYGVKRYFIVTPVIEQHRIVGRILDHWKRDSSREWHPDRFEALTRVQLVEDFAAVKAEIFSKHGEHPEVVLTDASPLPNAVTYADYRRELENPERTKPSLIVFGTGWGISDVFYPEVHRILAPVYGLKNDLDGEYNHLSVRAAAAIILDRLFGH